MTDSSDEFESDLSCESEYESVESSDEWESESSSEEEEVDSDSEVVEGGKRGVPSGSVSSKSKRQKPATKAKRQTKSKKTTASKYMDEEQLKELASWVFSAEQADLVEEHIRKQLPECPNIETVTERKDLVAHVLSGQQKQNFKLLIVGFCRKFSSLAMEYYTLAAKDRKARFSIAWMKVLTNFQPKRPTQAYIFRGKFKTKNNSVCENDISTKKRTLFAPSDGLLE